VSTPRKPVARIFDIRNIIGALLAIYGALLVLAGVAPGLLAPRDASTASGNTVDLYIGTDANWWVGVALLAVAAVFIAWAALRPVVDVESEEEDLSNS
jgi:putative Ca2+/H+ antiporter (TMEM165/GDT1 family)